MVVNMLCCELVSVPNDERTNGVKILRKKGEQIVCIIIQKVSHS